VRENSLKNRPGINPGRYQNKTKNQFFRLYFVGRLRGDGAGTHNKKNVPIKN